MPAQNSTRKSSRRAARTLLTAGALITGVLVLPVTLATEAQAASLTEVDFGVSSGYQSWTVPTGVNSVTMNVYGGAGGDGRQGSSCALSSGAGGWVNAQVPVTPGQTLSIWVGSGGHLSGAGGAATPDGTFGGGSGGGAGYGPVSGNGGGGGGATAIWASSSHREDNLLIVAGGGGGGGGGGGTATQCGGKGGTGGLPATDGKAAPASLGSGGAGGPANQYDQQLNHSGTNGLTPPNLSGATEIGGGGGGGGAGLHDCTYDSLFDNFDCYGIGHGGINGGDDAAGNGGGGGGGGTSFTADSITNPFLSSAGASGDAGGVQISFGSATSTSISSGVAHTGDTVALHAFVEASDGGGSVAFTSDGSTISGCGLTPFSSGGGTTWEATCSTSTLPAGVHEIAATYSGDDAVAGSASSAFWTILQATHTTVSTSPSSPASPGGTVVIDALVAPIDGGGTVRFTDDGNAISGCSAVDPQPQNDGSWHATCSTATPDLGSHTFGAAYSGD